MAQNMIWRKGVIVLLLALALLLTLNLYLLWLLVEQAPDADGQIKLAEQLCADAPERGQIYVPAYSHIYQGGLPILLEIALSLRNTDPSASITINSVDYFDDNGKLLRRHLKQPLTLGPLMSAEYLIEKPDFAGGMGANFLITWSAEESPSPPLADALMSGGEKGQWFSFSSRGVAAGKNSAGRRCTDN